MSINQSVTPEAAKLLAQDLSRLEKYKQLQGVKDYIENFTRTVEYLQRSYVHEPFPKLPPIADIPTDDLLKEIKRRIEYHPGPVG